MVRPRARDYDDKRRTLLKGAARLFAEQGYDRTSMTELASTLGVSKALAYHYYASKEALLHDIIASHLEELAVAAETAFAAPGSPRERFHALVTAILDCYRDADDEHRIQIADLRRLPEAQQEALRALERRLVRVMVEAVANLNPALPRSHVTPLAMSIFGTLNWKFMWFREDGAMGRESYVALVTKLFADGIAAATIEPVAAGPSRAMPQAAE